MADGTLRFDTRIDDSGFVEGIKKLSSKQIKLQNEIKKTQMEMTKLEQAIKQMESAKVPTEEYKAIQAQIAEAQKKLNGYLETEQRMKDTGVNTQSRAWQNLQWKIEDARNALRAAKADLAALEASGGAFVTGGDPTKLADMRAKYDLLGGKLSEYQARLAEVTAKEEQNATSGSRVSRALGMIASAASRAWSGMQSLGNVMTSTFRKTGQLMAGVMRFAKSAILNLRKMTSIFSFGNKITNKFSSGMSRVLRSLILYRGILKILRNFIQTTWTALKTNEQFTSSLSKIKGNLYTAFQPIIDAAMPAINTLMSGLVKLTGYLAQFTSMLFGRTVKASQAAAKAQYKQAQAMEDASKSANNQLSSIDKLNNIVENKTGSDSGKVQPNFTYDIETSENVTDFVDKLKQAWENADFSEIGKIIAGKINDALKSINWENIQLATQKLARSIYTGINGYINEFDWQAWGATIGKGINTAVNFANDLLKGTDWSALGVGMGTKLQSIFDTIDWNALGMLLANGLNSISKYINSFYESADWTGFGSKVATSLNTAISNINWSNVGQALSNGLNIAIRSAYGFITTFDWSALGAGIGTNLQSIFDTIDWNALGMLLANGLNSISKYINSFYESADWTGFGSKIATSLNTSISNINWSNVGQALSNGLNIAIRTAYGFITTFDWSGLGQGVADSINKFMSNTDWTKLAKGASSLASGLLNTVTTAIREIDWQAIGNTIGDMISNIDWLELAESVIDLLVSAFNGLVSLIFGIGETIAENIMEGLSNGISLSEIIKNAGKWIKDHIFSPIINNIKKLFGIHSPSTVMEGIGRNIIQGMINGITSLVENVKTKFNKLVEDIKKFFENLPTWFRNKFTDALNKIKEVFGITAVKTHFSNVWDGIKSCFSKVSDWFKDTFTKAWTNVKNVFSTGGKIYDGIKEGIGDTFKAVVNKLIDGINTIIAVPFNAINGMLNKIRNVSILGFEPFKSFWGENPLKVPQIPKLATGTVVPANYGEFLAILGDNKREAEVVSPLSTMKQALKEVIQEMGGSGAGTINLNVYLSGKQIHSEVVRVDQEYRAQTGKSAFAY